MMFFILHTVLIVFCIESLFLFCRAFQWHPYSTKSIKATSFNTHLYTYVNPPESVELNNKDSNNIDQHNYHKSMTKLSIPTVGSEMPQGKRPDWFRVPSPGGPGSKFEELKQSITDLNLHTVCQEAQCPNIGECWNGGTGTIMLLGDTCTRGCRFCAVKTDSKPAAADPLEPFKTAEALSKWNISYVVLTSVDRDDMPDGGASHFANTVQLIKQTTPHMLVECLVSDFAGDLKSVKILATSGLDVYAHNVETVKRLQRHVRDIRAGYDQSLTVLKHAKTVNPNILTKTSLMLGLGETKEEVVEAMRDVLAAGVDVITFGQYMRPTDHHLTVVEYIHPDMFAWYKQVGQDMGFKYIASGPLVRSSYKAGEYYIEHMIKIKQKQQSTHGSDSRSMMETQPSSSVSIKANQ